MVSGMQRQPSRPSTLLVEPWSTCRRVGQLSRFASFSANARVRHRAFIPHSLVLTMVGTGMLWVGWYGSMPAAQSQRMALRKRIHGYNIGNSGRLRGLASTRVVHARQTDGPRLLLRRRGRPGSHHTRGSFVMPTGAVIIGPSRALCLSLPVRH